MAGDCFPKVVPQTRVVQVTCWNAVKGSFTIRIQHLSHRMLTSRRDFLGIFAASSALAAIAPNALARIVGDHYWNRRLQLHLVKPSGWHFWSTLDFHAAAKQQVLHQDTPPEAEAILRNPDAAPFLVVAKLPATASGVSSAICAYDEAREDTYPPVVPCCLEALGAWARFLVGVEVAAPPRMVEVAGAEEAAVFSWAFEFEHANGPGGPVSVTTLLAYRPGRIHTLHFMALGDQSAGDTRLLQESRASVYYGDA